MPDVAVLERNGTGRDGDELTIVGPQNSEPKSRPVSFV